MPEPSAAARLRWLPSVESLALSLITDNDRVSADCEQGSRFGQDGAEIARRLRVGPWRQLLTAYAQVMAAAGASRDGGRALAHIGTARAVLSIAMEELQRIARGIDPGQRAEYASRALFETKLSDQAEVKTSRHRRYADKQRRREIERDLHDGAQQRLVSLDLMLHLAERQIRRGKLDDGTAVLREALQALEAGMHELTQLASGIHPDAVRNEGLAAALSAIAGRTPLRVDLDISVPEPIHEAIEVAAYFVVAEALTNTLKHAGARRASVTVRQRPGHLLVIVADDGRGGADARVGSGLRGLAERAKALDGALIVDSRAGRGTVLTVRLPTPNTVSDIEERSKPHAVLG